MKDYEGRDIEVSFDPARCLHAGECVRGLPAVFDTKRKPWINPDDGPAEEIAEVVRRCPSGALHYELAGAGEADGERPQYPTTVRAAPDGPIWIRGDLELEVSGEIVTETRAALCSCGKTGNGPFCDHSGACKPG